MVERGNCGYCGKIDVLLSATPESNDAYCKDCLKHMMTNYKLAIQEITDYEKDKKTTTRNRKIKLTEEDLAKLEREKDEALANLMREKYY